MMRQKWVHSLFAVTMLIAFGSMMAIKDHHHHDHHCAACLPISDVTVAEADDCPICQFSIAPQLAQTAVVAVEAPMSFVLLRSFFLFSYTAVSTDVVSLRGPPAC